jgi:thioesterase domain-containing protein/acyl carrier protein
MGYFIVSKDKEDLQAKEIIPLGRGIEGVQLLVLNDARQMAGVGELGEIYIRTPYLARGYLDDDRLTQQRFIVSPFTPEIPGDRLYRTGDKGRYLPDGSVEFAGRSDDQVKIRGFRIHLGEIEAALRQHPAVRESVVLCREHATEQDPGNPKSKTRAELSRSIEPPKSNRRLVAYLVTKQGAAPTTTELRAFLQQKLPEYMVPAVFVSLAALPLTPNGKVDRRGLSAPERARPELEQTFMAPRTPVEDRLAAIWADLLDLDQVGIHDNFFDVGGHSLLAVRLFAQIEKEFAKRLPLSSLFQRATVEHLASLLAQPTTPSNGSSSLVAIQPHGSKRPFFCVHELFGDVLCYANLARQLGDERPFYALQARGLHGPEEPLTDIEAMAASYIREIRTVQPHGPYAVGGLCIGGVVAFEMAQQLRAKGETVALVALLDSWMSPKRGSAAWWSSFLRNLPRDFHSWLIGALQLNRSQWATLIEQKIRMTQASLRRAWSADGLRSDDDSWRVRELGDLFHFSEQHGKVALAQHQALKRYTPKVYPGRLTLFRARMQPFFSSHAPDKGWERLAAGGLEIKVVPGNHLGMLQEPHVKVLAAQLRACLQQTRTSSNCRQTFDHA